MPCYVGLDASKRSTKICIIDKEGAIVREGSVESTPQAISGFLRGDRLRYARVGMEAWTLAPWLYAGLARAGLPIICIEAWQAHSVLEAMRANKTDKNDARGIAQIMRVGIYKSVHVKSPESQRLQALITARKLLKTKVLDIENGVRGALLVLGLKLGSGVASTFERRVRTLVGSARDAAQIIEPLLSVRAHTIKHMTVLEDRMKAAAAADPVCRRLMTAPGVGPITALMFRTSIDEPLRFPRSRAVGAHFGLTAKIDASGEKVVLGRITKRGDRAVRAALYLAASSHFRPGAKTSWLKEWALGVAATQGNKRAIVALARRLAVVLHKMWVTETDFRWTVQELDGRAEAPAI